MLRRPDWDWIFRAAVNPSLEAAGKTLRCAVPAVRKPGVAIPGHPRDACVAPMFFTPRKIPSQSRRRGPKKLCFMAQARDPAFPE